MDNIEYEKALEAIDELLDKVNESTPLDSPEMIKLVSLSDQIEEYELKHFALPEPNFIDRVRYYFEHRFTIKNVLPWKMMKL